MKELKREIKTMETYGYEATDGTYFRTKEQCEKYEETCECVIMTAFKKEVKFYIDEDTMFETGADDYGYYFIDVTENNIDAINKALVYYYDKARLVDREYIGKEIMVFVEYANNPEGICRKVLSGYWTTMDEKINEIKATVDRAREKGDK